MHSIPQIVLSPDQKYILGQSMDNRIITYEAEPQKDFGHGVPRPLGASNTWAARPLGVISMRVTPSRSETQIG